MKPVTILLVIGLACATVAALEDDALIDEMAKNQEVAFRLKQAIKAVKQVEQGPIQQIYRTNFLQVLQTMAEGSAIVGANASRASATLIRGLVQDSFNLGSIAAYLPRLIFLDGPSQFIETLRLIRTNQIRIPMDMDSAIDTLINFAASVRDAPVVNNVASPFLSFFPNIFRGSEALSGEILFSVFSWLAPLNPSDINVASAATFNNRWDSRSTTTRKPVFHE